MNRKIGFIGCGNMGEAMVQGFINSNQINANNIYVHTKTNESSLKLKDNYGIQISKSNVEVVKNSDFIFLAVKPNLYPEVIKEIIENLSEDKVLISITPSYTLKELNEMADAKCKIIRTIPNTSSMYNVGFTSVVFRENELDYIKKEFTKLINLLGKSIIVNEDKIALLSTLSGSSPALIYLFSEVFVNYGVANGLTEDEAKYIFSQTLLGTSKMILESNQNLNQLVKNVCSPNGSTIEGVKHLESLSFSKILEESLEKITNRFNEMNKKS